MMADEFNFSGREFRITLQRQISDLISVPDQIEVHGRCRCGVLLSPCFGALLVVDPIAIALIVGMQELELHYRCRGRFNF